MYALIAGRTGFLLILSISLAWACGQGGPVSVPLGTPPPPPSRPADGLLGRPALQRVVDLQVQRDGEGLIALLGDPDVRVRARSAFALASVQDPDAGPALVRVLGDPEPAVRRDAAFALGQLSDPSYAPNLLGALEGERSPEVRGRMIEAVGKAGDSRALERLLGLPLLPGEEAARNLAISRMGVRGEVLPSGIQHLITGLRSADPEERLNAGYYFGRTRSPGPWAPRADQLRAVLDSLAPEDPLAMHLLLAFGTLGDPRDNPRLVGWLTRSPDWRIRANAARALGGRVADPLVRNRLMEALEEPSTHVASYAAEALAGARELASPDREALKEWVLEHPGEWLRAGPILTLLARVGDGAFILEWLGGWDEKDVPQRTRGLNALAFVPGDAAMDALVAAVGSESARIRGSALGGLARRWRVEREDPAKHGRYFQAFALGLRSGDLAAVSVAAPSLADSLFLPLGSVDLLAEVYAAMSESGGQEGVTTVLGALGETGSPEAEAILRGALGSEKEEIRVAATRALATMSGEDQPGPNLLPGPAQRIVDWGALAALGPSPRLVLETSKGRVRVVLDSEGAPLTVQTITGFALEGRYSDVPFHRVVPNFVVQGGDFSRRDGFGGPGFNIRSEFTETPYLRGVLGMASSGKDTEGSQFFITHSMQPHLDGGYTVFGWVEEGMDVVDSLYEEDLILSALVEPGIE